MLLLLLLLLTVADEKLLEERERYYRIMQRVSGLVRSELQRNIRNYTVDPASRYHPLLD